MNSSSKLRSSQVLEGTIEVTEGRSEYFVDVKAETNIVDKFESHQSGLVSLEQAQGRMKVLFHSNNHKEPQEIPLSTFKISVDFSDKT